MEALVYNMSLSQKWDISRVLKAVVLIMLHFLQNSEEVIRAACTKAEIWVFSVENLWLQILFPPLLRVHNKSSLDIFTWGNNTPEWYVIAYPGATNIFNLVFYKSKSTNIYGFPELFMNWGTVWWKGKYCPPQAWYLKNSCTEQADRPMHLHLSSEWAGSFTADPSSAATGIGLHKFSAPGAEMCPRHSQNAAYGGLDSSWDNRPGGCIAKFSFSMWRHIRRESPHSWLATMQYDFLWIFTIFFEEWGGVLDFDWHLWSPEWPDNLPQPSISAEDSATVWVSGLCCQDGPNLGHIQKFCRWPIILGWHFVSSSPDLRFVLQDILAKWRWNVVSFCSKRPKGLGGKSIYLTDLARRALCWWVASVQALSLTGTGRII